MRRKTAYKICSTLISGTQESAWNIVHAFCHYFVCAFCHFPKLLTITKSTINYSVQSAKWSAAATFHLITPSRHCWSHAIDSVFRVKPISIRHEHKTLRAKTICLTELHVCSAIRFSHHDVSGHIEWKKKWRKTITHTHSIVGNRDRWPHI